VHTSKYPIVLYQPYSVATLEYSELLSSENYVRIVALTPVLPVVSVYSVIEFPHHRSTIELLLLLNTYKKVLSEL
jgi:hypothetical protein